VPLWALTLLEKLTAACDAYRAPRRASRTSQLLQRLEERPADLRSPKLIAVRQLEAPDQEDKYMLRSSNPILSRQDAFTPAAPQYNQNPYNQPQPGYSQYPTPGYPQAPVEPAEGRMTFDDVVTKTALTMGILIIAAALAWMFVPDALYFPALIASGLIGFIVVMIVAFRRRVQPGLVLLYAAIEGVFIGMISKVFENLYEGIVVQAVIGTFAAAAVTLAAYKFFNIRVTPKFRKVVIIATIAFAVALLINFVANLFRAQSGLPRHRNWSDQHAGGRLLLDRCDARGPEPRAGLRLHRAGRRHGRAGKRVVARRVRADRDNGLAVHRDTATAVLHSQVVGVAARRFAVRS
jgi:uncharacterized YccA/Bax inhibitor family protein